MPFAATVLTLYPEMFPGPLGVSLAGRALASGLWALEARDIRVSATDKHRSVDDTPAGGGPGMVLMGSADAPLELSFREMLANDWEVVGQFMYDRTAPGQLAALAAEGLLDLGKINVTTFPLADFPRAVDAAAMMQSLDLTAVLP
jgi:alcohol dehydrogenase